VEVIEVDAHELELSEIRNLISYAGPVMSLDDAYGRIKDFYGAESVRAAYPGTLGDASISVHDTEDGSSRTLTASKAGSQAVLTVTVSRNAATDATAAADAAHAAGAVTVVYDAGGTEPTELTIRAEDVNPLVDALIDGALATTVPFRELPVPADWSDLAVRDTPVPAVRRLSITPVVTEIRVDLGELARSAGLEARLNEIRAAATMPPAEVFDSLAAELGPSVSQLLSAGPAGHTRAVIDVSADSAISLQLAQSVVNRNGQQVALSVSGVQIAELCPPLG
jgi:hypothetical protein